MPSPWGATVSGVRQLVQDIVAAAPAIPGTGTNPRAPRVADVVVEGWINDAANRVAIATPGTESLPLVVLDLVDGTRRQMVELWAASLLSDVSHPERAGQTGRLGMVLMDRYTTGMAVLVPYVAKEVERSAPDPTDPELGISPEIGAAALFRSSSQWERRRF